MLRQSHQGHLPNIVSASLVAFLLVDNRVNKLTLVISKYVVVRLELQPPKARCPATCRVSSHERVTSNRERVDEAVSSTTLVLTQRARVTRHRARPAGSTCQGRVLPRLHTTAPRGTHNHARSHGYRMLMLHASLSHCLARTLAPRASPSGAAQGEDAKAGSRHGFCSMRMLLGGLTCPFHGYRDIRD